jgi:ABC-type polysaccharide/polyol phosphate transport system ATPase subunit
MIRLTNVTKCYPTSAGRLTVLNSINLTIQPGERVGIMGRNGAGKSTLVRVISGAEPPTSGTVERHMRVSWPLAFSGGMHGRLTGADNLRFICRIYGVEFKERLEFVKEFSELGAFLNEPVQNYSSGMRARLAFGISMAIDFDCYLIDEVMAVGDERFSERCEVELFQKRGHKTFVVVSHSRKYVERVCNRFLIFNEGRLEEYADFSNAIFKYKQIVHSERGAVLATR